MLFNVSPNLQIKVGVIFMSDIENPLSYLEPHVVFVLIYGINLLPNVIPSQLFLTIISS